MTCRATSDTITLPSAPTGLTLVGTDSSLVLDWENNPASEQVTNYKVYRATNQGGPFTLKSSPTTSTHTDTTGVSGTTYWYRVSAVNSTGEGPYTETTGSFVLDSTAPGEVTITTGPTQVGGTAVTLTWTDPTDSDYAGAKVYAKQDAGAYTLVSGSALVVTGAFTHTSATGAHDWRYKITTKDVAGNESTGVISSIVTIMDPDTTPPDAPTGLTATGRSDGIFLSWTPNTEYDVADYNIQRNDLGGDLGSVGAATPTSYLDTTAVVGVPHTYTVTAVDASSNVSDSSAESNSATRLETSVTSLDSFIKTGSMVPCVCFARGINYRRYTAVDNTDKTTTVTFVESEDFLAIATGTQLTTDYLWNFASGSGQPNGLWNPLKGWNAAHAYDQAGKYTVKLTRTDSAGKADVFASTINLAPDTRTVIYCTPSGSSSSANSGTNSGAPVSPARAQAILNTTANVKIRLQNGTTYSTTGTFLSLTRPNQMVESFQFGTTVSSAKATINFSAAPSGTRSMFKVVAAATGAVIQKLAIGRSYTPSGDTQANQDHFVDISGDGGTLVRDCTINATGTAINFDNSTSKNSRYVLVQGCSAPNRTSLSEYFAFVQGQDLVLLGNMAVNSLRAHVLRASQHSRTLAAFNIFTDADHEQTDPFDICRTPFTIQHGVDFYGYQNTLTADITQTDAKVGISKQNGAISIGPLREANGHKAQYLKYCCMEGNRVNAMFAFQSGATDVICRNNIIDRTDSLCFQLTPLTGTDAAGLAYDLPNARIYLLNNTIRDNGLTGTILRVGSSVDSLEFINNHCIGSNLSANSSNALCCDLRGGFGSSNKVQRNCFPATANFRVGSVTESLAVFNLRSQCDGTNTKENTLVDSNFRPANGSVAATCARPKAGVYDDVKNTSRNLHATSWTAGAYQL